MPLVIWMATRLKPEEIQEVAAIAYREEMPEVYQIKDNHGGTYFQGKPKGGPLQKFTIERKPNETITP